jgi:predicted permease
MTFDEGSSIHELLMEPMGRLMGNDHPRIFYFTWLVPACIAVALIGLLFIKFLIDLPAKARWGFLLAAAFYLGGAMGFEMISGELASYIGIHNFDFDVLSTIEETLEMSGAILFIYALLSYISDHYRSILFKLNP